MSLPSFQCLMLPVLEIAAQGEISGSDLRSRVAERLRISEADLAERLPRAPTTVFANRVAWGKVYLQRAGLIEKTSSRLYRATQTGSAVLEEHPEKIDLTFLQRFPSYTEWRRGIGPSTDSSNGAP